MANELDLITPFDETTKWDDIDSGNYTPSRSIADWTPVESEYGIIDKYIFEDMPYVLQNDEGQDDLWGWSVYIWSYDNNREMLVPDLRVCKAFTAQQAIDDLFANTFDASW